MLGNREDGEEALQQTFLRAHQALSDGRPPQMLRPWLFAIARNRCRTMLAARRDAPVPSELPESGFDDLAEQVRRRAELRELVADLGRLPEEQRAALVLAELGDLDHGDIGAVLGWHRRRSRRSSSRRARRSSPTATPAASRAPRSAACSRRRPAACCAARRCAAT